MRLIDADAMKAQISPVTKDDYKSVVMIGDVRKILHNFVDLQPTIDAVPVVRCGECKNWKKGNFQGGNDLSDLEYGGSCPLAKFARYESDFCSYGERKDGEV